MILGSSDISGFWITHSEWDSSQIEWMFVSENHRIIHCVVTAENGRPIPMRLWFLLESDVTYRIKPLPQHEGWTRRIYLKDSCLVIEAEEKTFTFERAAEDAVPIWFKDELIISHAKMDALEREIF